jgi:hypothetical protein
VWVVRCGRYLFMHNGNVGGFDKVRRKLMDRYATSYNIYVFVCVYICEYICRYVYMYIYYILVGFDKVRRKLMDRYAKCCVVYYIYGVCM